VRQRETGRLAEGFSLDLRVAEMMVTVRVSQNIFAVLGEFTILEICVTPDCEGAKFYAELS
jgi:predicted transcriptional regulator